ncbi:glutaredoxin domain-containing protein [Dactylosporangium sp. NPDC005555]|uniref:glutaredoxin domain-containing protein n=1 Tax=Dactylosporangium sp. NPDC005555 TaxID=3154889 RepID=UPI0033ADDFFB
MRVWRTSLLFAVLAVALAVVLRSEGSPGAAALVAAVLLALAIGYSPLIYPAHVPATVAQASGRPVVYWRPGCPFCLRLRLSLIGRAGQASWVNIWQDPDGAAAVRAVANGNETVPTVVLPSAGAHVNPAPAWLRKQLTNR